MVQPLIWSYYGKFELVDLGATRHHLDADRVGCPDRDTADRVMGAFNRQANRVSDTLVAIDQKKLTSTERSKLRDRGIIVQRESEAPAGKSKVPKKKKRW